MTCIDFLARVRRAPVFSCAERLETLARLHDALQRHWPALETALFCDLGKSPLESRMSEWLGLRNSLEYYRRNLPRLCRKKAYRIAWLNRPGVAFTVPEAYGAALIVSTWNYPLLLALDPLVAAWSAGCPAVLSLPPQTAHVNAVLAQILADFPDWVFVNASIPVETLLETCDFDVYFFTGGHVLGRKVARAAADHLAPCILELGGKSPCVVCADADLTVAAKRIVQGKFLNAGQTCVAPDYCLVERAVYTSFTEILQRTVRAFFGEDARHSPDYSRIVSEAHVLRLCALLENQHLLCGGESDVPMRYMAPTLVDNPAWDSPLMQNEIFGPILPLIPVDDADSARTLVKAHGKPLALYVFTRNSAVFEAFVAQTSSGSAVQNACVTQLANPELPFGGVGQSGIGAYHGEAGFWAFSHEKTVMKQPFWCDFSVRYPPFSDWKKRLLYRFLK